MLETETMKDAALLLGVVSCILALLGFTRLAKLKIFNFVTGEFAMTTAMAYGSLMALKAVHPWSKWWLLWCVWWFTIASIKFATAIFYNDN